MEQNQHLLKDRNGMRDLIFAGATLFGFYSGTCRMATDNSYVVDEKLRVQGLSGLVILDESVISSIP